MIAKKEIKTAAYLRKLKGVFSSVLLRLIFKTSIFCLNLQKVDSLL